MRPSSLLPTAYCDCLPGGRGLVDGLDDRHRLAALAAIDERLAPVAEGGDEVGQLPRVALVRDRGGVAGAARRPRLLREALAHLLVGLRRRLEVPAQDVVL